MKDFHQRGFVVLNDFYSCREVKEMIRTINAMAADSPVFRRSNDLFAIRQVLKEIPCFA